MRSKKEFSTQWSKGNENHRLNQEELKTYNKVEEQWKQENSITDQPFLSIHRKICYFFVCNNPINQTITWCHDVMGPRLYCIFSMLWCFVVMDFGFIVSYSSCWRGSMVFYFTFACLISIWFFNPRSSRLCISMNTSIPSPSLFGWYFCFSCEFCTKTMFEHNSILGNRTQFEMFGSNVSCWILLFTQWLAGMHVSASFSRVHNNSNFQLHKKCFAVNVCRCSIVYRFSFFH